MIFTLFAGISISQARACGRQAAWHGSSKGASADQDKRMSTNIAQSVTGKVVLASDGSRSSGEAIAGLMANPVKSRIRFITGTNPAGGMAVTPPES